MNRLKEEKQIAILSMLVEGNSIRSIERMTGVHRDTIMRLMVRVGERCQAFMDATMKNLGCTRLELDEIWTFCGKKQLRLSEREKRCDLLGDQYVFYGIDPVTKLIPTWTIGKRDNDNTVRFVKQLKGSLNGVRPQISTDAFFAYVEAIEMAFGSDVDYASIAKEYESVPVGPGRYAPPRVSGTVKRVYQGKPNSKYICTSYVERHNLTIRTFMRRFTRLSLGFSKKMANLRAAVALHFAYYNFCWIPRTTGVTPAMQAGITNYPWTLGELLGRSGGRELSIS
jgi:IS1 family transposase